MSAVSRRGFLGSVGAALVAVVTPLGRIGRAGASVAAGPTGGAAIVVPLFFSDAVATTRIGSSYLAAAPEDGDIDLLLEALTPAGEVPLEWWANVTVTELRRTVRAKAHADFAASDVVDVVGWQLARSEARLTALFTLL